MVATLAFAFLAGAYAERVLDAFKHDRVQTRSNIVLLVVAVAAVAYRLGAAS